MFLKSISSIFKNRLTYTNFKHVLGFNALISIFSFRPTILGDHLITSPISTAIFLIGIIPKKNNIQKIFLIPIQKLTKRKDTNTHARASVRKMAWEAFVWRIWRWIERENGCRLFEMSTSSGPSSSASPSWSFPSLDNSSATNFGWVKEKKRSWLKA